ncbi:MAG: PEP/pyruvate-binding domain-containing protein, partial [Eubacteriales bacterium]
EQFMHILEYYGQDPYIVRSSSILEDGFDNAFAGKYESVFCANRGTLEERLEEFENAVRTVYASSAGLSALDYRKRRGLDRRDEQMALLVMRVSGSAYGSYFMPCAAGVGYSFSPYKFLGDTDSSAGMLRLVMGLGTSAVDRTEGSYPRLISLDKPEVTNFTTVAEKHQYSQRRVEAVNIRLRNLSRVPLEELEPILPNYLKNQVLEHDTDAEASLRERGDWRNICFISCLGLVRNREMMERMRRMMHIIQQEYGEPVDIEFTINVSENREYMINLLQCRPLQVFRDTEGITVPENVPEEEILLETRHASMGLSRKIRLDMIIYVDPVKYYQLPYSDKTRTASLISRINWKYRDQGKHILLMVPGRIGTSSPELGVPTAFSDISSFDAVCEMAESRAGYNPELSYGSHIFQDLVEAQILYMAVFPGDRTLHFQPELLKYVPDTHFEAAEGIDLREVVRVADVSGRRCEMYHDLKNEHILIRI